MPVPYNIPTNIPTENDFSNKVYIDPSQGTNGDGSESNPYNTLIGISGNLQMPSDTAYLIKRGTTLDERVYKQFRNVYIGAYGTGNKPVLTQGIRLGIYDNLGSESVTLDNLNIQSESLSTSTSGGNDAILFIDDVGIPRTDNFWIVNCYLTGTYNESKPLKYPYRAFKGKGNNYTFYNNIISYVSDDGLGFGSGDNITIVRNWIHHVDMKRVGNEYTDTQSGAISDGSEYNYNCGDCIHMNYHNNVYIAGNLIDRSNTSWKFAFILKTPWSSDRRDVTVEYNTFIGNNGGPGGGAVVYLEGPQDSTFTKNVFDATNEGTNQGSTGIYDSSGNIANQANPYGIYDNHFIRGSNGTRDFYIPTSDLTTINNNNELFTGYDEYDTYLTNNTEIGLYGSDIDTSDFWQENEEPPNSNNMFVDNPTAGQYWPPLDEPLYYGKRWKRNYDNTAWNLVVEAEESVVVDEALSDTSENPVQNKVIKEAIDNVDESKWELENITSGFRLPTEDEWNEERLTWDTNDSAGAFGSVLKLPVAGFRHNSSGSLYDVGSHGRYWSSTVDGTNSWNLYFFSSNASIGSYRRAIGHSIRLIKEGTFTSNPNETITINGLTYQTVFNPITGKVWLDRNLGATQVATSSTDADAYGDLYQWGRLADGHEKRDSVIHDGDVDGKPSTPTESGAWDGKFITTNESPYDWLDPQDNNLWQGIEGVNNPAPSTQKYIPKNEIPYSLKDSLEVKEDGNESKYLNEKGEFTKVDAVTHNQTYSFVPNPSDYSKGDEWLNPETLRLYKLYDSDGTNIWVEIPDNRILVPSVLKDVFFDTSDTTKTMIAGETLDLTVNLTEFFTGNKTVRVKYKLKTVFDEVVSFTSGVGQLTVPVEQITVADESESVFIVVDGFEYERNGLTVEPATPTQIIITQQPNPLNEGTFDGSPIDIGDLIVNVADEFGNLGDNDINYGEFMLTLEPIDPLTSEAILTIDGQNSSTYSTFDDNEDGSILFLNLAVNNENGIFRIQISETYGAYPTIETDDFEMVNMEDLSSFEIVDPGPQVQDTEFTITLANVNLRDGSPLTGDRLVSVTQIDDDLNEIVLIDQKVFSFSSGLADLLLTAPIPSAFDGFANNFTYTITIHDINVGHPTHNPSESVMITINEN